MTFYVVAALCFGVWQGDVWAGVFVFFTAMVFHDVGEIVTL